jgi:hypothetical protein
MKPAMQHCDYEPAVVRAVRIGSWTEELRAHFAACPVCADAVLIAEALHGEPAESLEVPAAGLIWWKAQLRRRLDGQERALRPIVWAERGAIAAGLGGVAWTAAWVASSNPLLAAVLAGALVAAAAAGSLLWAAARR